MGKKGTYLQYYTTPSIDVSQMAKLCPDMLNEKREIIGETLNSHQSMIICHCLGYIISISIYHPKILITNLLEIVLLNNFILIFLSITEIKIILKKTKN